MPENTSDSPHGGPWESGWSPDTSRAPGTRRLWLAGVLAVATVVACVTAIAVTDSSSDDLSGTTPDPVSAGDARPGLISFATPSTGGTTAPGAKSASPSARPTSAASRPHSSKSASPGRPSASAPSRAGASEAPPAATWRSVGSVNYPDRYWHVSGDLVRLDPIGSAAARQEATFRLVDGLSDASCHSFATPGGAYLRHRDFVLRAEPDDGSVLFEQDATFCPRPSAHAGAVMLESVNYPGRFLRHQDFQLRLDPVENSALYRADSAFRLVAGLR